MNDQRIAVLTDTGTDVPASFAAAHDVREVSLLVSYGEKTYRSGVDITTDDVVDRMPGEVPMTSLPSPDDVRAALAQARADGYERGVFVTTSSGLSSTCSVVELVARQSGDFPTLVVDSRSVGIGAGFVVMEAARLIEGGVAFDELQSRLEVLSSETRIFFAMKDLAYTRRGGRINEATYRLGTVLNIKPILSCDEQGRVIVLKKARGWERALASELELAQERAKKFGSVVCSVCCTKTEDRTAELMARLRSCVSNLSGVFPSALSPDLVVHTGPALVGIAVRPETL